MLGFYSCAFCLLIWGQESGVCRMEKGRRYFPGSWGSNEFLIFFQSICPLIKFSIFFQDIIQVCAQVSLPVLKHKKYPTNDCGGTQQKSFICGSAVELHGGENKRGGGWERDETKNPLKLETIFRVEWKLRLPRDWPHRGLSSAHDCWSIWSLQASQWYLATQRAGGLFFFILMRKLWGEKACTRPNPSSAWNTASQLSWQVSS